MLLFRESVFRTSTAKEYSPGVAESLETLPVLDSLRELESP
jgi:hypothetical protein